MPVFSDMQDAREYAYPRGHGIHTIVRKHGSREITRHAVVTGETNSEIIRSRGKIFDMVEEYFRAETLVSYKFTIPSSAKGDAS